MEFWLYLEWIHTFNGCEDWNMMGMMFFKNYVIFDSSVSLSFRNYDNEENLVFKVLLATETSIFFDKMFWFGTKCSDKI